ncbi:MAG: hypothetical protein KAV41_02745 [Candidatus Pacebacteria bacterium]|nr:hypothetical protein [Candidatus Paceibacterota bacterium]
MFKFQKIYIVYFFISAFWLLSFFWAEAGQLYFDPEFGQFGKSDQFKITLFIDTAGKSLNALETEIIYPTDLLRMLKISGANSIINFWIEKPADQNGIVFLSGIIPGGFDGVLKPFSQKKHPGEIINLTFETLKKGTGSVFLQNTQALLNDGLGTAANVFQTPYLFDISDYGGAKKITDLADLTPPEEFKVEISNAESVFNGKYFLVFYTQDKSSGISYYEVQEGRRNFKIAESPYLLKNQKLDEEIIVRAIDKVGNVREEKLAAVNEKRVSFFWFIIILIILFSIIWRHKEKK